MFKSNLILGLMACVLSICTSKSSFANGDGLPPGIPADDPRRVSVMGASAADTSDSLTPPSLPVDTGNFQTGRTQPIQPYGVVETIAIPSLADLELQIGLANEQSYVASTQGSINGGLNPSQKLSRAELNRAAKKQRMALSQLAQTTRGVTTQAYPGYWQWVSVVNNKWIEPENAAYVNYCGPSAGQVALDVRLEDWQIPSLYDIGQEMYINPSWGVYMTSVRDVLNRRLNTTWYEASGSGNANNFVSRASADLTRNYAMVTALQTSGLPGWGPVNVNHIVTVYAMYVGDGTYSIAWVDTASNMARHNQPGGSYLNYMYLGRDFYNGYVSRNDVQAW